MAFVFPGDIEPLIAKKHSLGAPESPQHREKSNHFLSDKFFTAAIGTKCWTASNCESAKKMRSCSILGGVCLGLEPFSRAHCTIVTRVQCAKDMPKPLPRCGFRPLGLAIVWLLYLLGRKGAHDRPDGVRKYSRPSEHLETWHPAGPTVNT